MSRPPTSLVVATLEKSSYHVVGKFDSRSAIGFSDRLLHRVTLSLQAGKTEIALVSLSEETNDALESAPEIVASLAAASLRLPSERVTALAAEIRLPLRSHTARFFTALAVSAYTRRLQLEGREIVIPFEASKRARIARAARRALDSAGNQVYEDSAQVILAHLQLMAEAGVPPETLAKRLSELVAERAIVLTEFVTEFLDLPTRSTQGLAYLIGLSDNPEVYEIENVAISLRDDDTPEEMLRAFMRTRTTLDARSEPWRQALARAIWEGYGKTDHSWATAEEPKHYLLRSAKNRFRREYRGAEIPLHGEALPSDDVLDGNGVESFNWEMSWGALASSTEEATVLPVSLKDNLAELDIKRAFHHLSLEKHLPVVLQRYRLAHGTNRLPELPKAVERARPRLERLLKSSRPKVF
jgi:hypothetical protein